ncbi:hypothetical protein Hanom_Chr16g01465231 [Helianthus anomalus]
MTYLVTVVYAFVACWKRGRLVPEMVTQGSAAVEVAEVVALCRWRRWEEEKGGGEVVEEKKKEV